MNKMIKKNIKLIMELIFIFILPLVFICFTSEIQVERNFEYDNNGNYETSQETKKLSFDNSIIKYTKQTETILTSETKKLQNVIEETINNIYISNNLKIFFVKNNQNYDSNIIFNYTNINDEDIDISINLILTENKYYIYAYNNDTDEEYYGNIITFEQTSYLNNTEIVNYINSNYSYYISL